MTFNAKEYAWAIAHGKVTKESEWPVTRDLKTFREWFRIDIHNVVVDIAEDEIEGEDL